MKLTKASTVYMSLGQAPEMALDVVWLCRPHHQEAHRAANQ